MINIKAAYNTLLNKTAYKASEAYTKNNIRTDLSLYEVADKKTINDIMQSLNTIGNYAKAKKVKVCISGCKGEVANTRQLKEEADVNNRILLSVTDKKNNTKGVFISTIENNNTPFIRRLYENLQKLCGEESQIVNHKKQAACKLYDNKIINKVSFENLLFKDYKNL